MQKVSACPSRVTSSVTSASTTAVSPANTFQDFTYTFVTGAVAPAGNVGIRLGATGGRGLFDNVRLDASVPEPSSLGLLGLTTLGIGAIRRRRR